MEDAAAAIRRALDGGAPYAPEPLLADAPPPDGTALVVRTSGSTGIPREVALSATALRASAAATHKRLGGPGRWFLALPATHVAGLQVISRSVVAGTRVGGGAAGSFTADGFAATAGAFLSDDGGSRAYVSLVPTQAHRLVEAADDGAPAGLDTLARFDAVLLGGAATPLPLLARLRDAGVRAVTTYGMSETCGGCVYDGVPLADVRVRLARDDAGRDAGRNDTARNTARDAGRDDGRDSAGRDAVGRDADDTGDTGAATGGPGDPQGSVPGVVEISGPVLATGYLGEAAATAAVFRTDPDGTRWFRTSDLGAVDADGRLTILGRADDVIVTGGVNVAPAAVEAALAELGEVCVVGVPDPEWGQVVTAVLARPSAERRVVGPTSSGRSPERPTAPTSDRPLDIRPTTTPTRVAPAPAELAERVRLLVADRLGRAAVPRRVFVTDAIPLRGPGKPDRRVLTEALTAAVG
ncbi:AMP-binding protein [Myceligenerans sp. TRM 65318]|uniref:AMP-binding protein n=1 Tax=Myceligenerans pegani TaxID=2776917 RepID=A0ABR9N4M8_9MICO|nr:AMP-binding protein [Myceligenerans sp. TRM 65318]MBE3020886.1 AMP-binding protein [Myceligenerans sp. TRM 65318]